MVRSPTSMASLSLQKQARTITGLLQNNGMTDDICSQCLQIRNNFTNSRYVIVLVFQNESTYQMWLNNEYTCMYKVEALDEIHHSLQLSKQSVDMATIQLRNEEYERFVHVIIAVSCPDNSILLTVLASRNAAFTVPPLAQQIELS
jgi:hypothetical protein